MSVYVNVPGNGLRIPTITEVMREHCEFVRYQDGALWYGIRYKTDAPADHPLVRPDYVVHESWWFEFPIPLDEHSAGVFEPEMKAVTLMRWIRKHIEFLTEARATEGDGG